MLKEETHKNKISIFDVLMVVGVDSGGGRYCVGRFQIKIELASIVTNSHESDRMH